MKKTISLIMAILLAATVFVSDIAGIAMVVRADEVYLEEIAAEEPATDESAGEPASEEPQYVDPEPDPQPDPGPVIDPDEEARQQAYEKEAEEARKAAEQAAAEEAAQEAQRQAEEAAKKAAEEAAAAAKAAEEKEKEEQNSRYALSASIGNISFGSAPVGAQRDVVPVTITNIGKSEVNLIFTESGDADGAFSVSFHSSNPVLGPGDSARFNVSMASDLLVGTYSAAVKFADQTRDPSYAKGITIPISGTVTGTRPVITNITVSPSKITLAKGGNAKFYADVSSNIDLIYDIIWSVSGANSRGTYVDDKGTLTVADDETATTIKVIATTEQDQSVSGMATVNIQSDSYNVNAYAEPANGGKVSGGGAVVSGGSVTLSAVPNQNFYFDGWVVDGKTVATSTNYTISNVTQNMNVTAKFSQNYVRVKTEVNNPDGGNVVGGGTIPYGGSTTLSAKAYDGYVFTKWTEDGDTISHEASIKLKNLTVDRKITAHFERTRHTLNVVASPWEGGTATGGGTFKLNEGTTLQATAKPGYTFQGWLVNGQYVSRSATYMIDKIKHDYTITAIFLQTGAITYEMSSGVATTGGSISPNGKLVVARGQNLTYTITPKSGFAILAVAVDGVQVGPVSTYTFSNIQGNHMIAVAFVQTDAGKKAAADSGKTPQTEKVKKIPKTTGNTATTESTVDIEDAAAGTGGDDYVEEMDLSDVRIPTDEELGVTEEIQQASDSEVARFLGMSMNEVDDMIQTGNTMPVLDAAFMTGGLGAYVYNKYEPASMVSVDYNKMTREELMQTSADVINPSLPDLDVVVQKMLSTDDVSKLAHDDHVDISVSITGQEAPDEATERIMKNAIGKKPVQYFDLTMLKSSDGNTEKVTELPTTMEVVIEIPQEVYKAGKKYSVLRVHNGELSVLPDLDDDPKTITFRTDRFSSYAIAQEVTSTKTLVVWLIAGAALAFGVAITCFMILIAHQRRMRRVKKAAHKG